MEQNRQIVSPMSNEGRNAYVVEHLTNSLLALLEVKPLADISISELCGGAGVGRTSFYRNFTDKEDILRAHIRQLFRNWTDPWGNSPDHPVGQLVLELFSHFEAHRAFYSLLNRRGLVYLLKDVILAVCRFDPEQEKTAAYASAYAAYSLYGWIEVWFLRGMREPAQELAALLGWQEP